MTPNSQLGRKSRARLRGDDVRNQILSENLLGRVSVAPADTQSPHPFARHATCKVEQLKMSLTEQTGFLFLLAIPIASVAWTVTHEEVFREPREWCARRSERCSRLYARKFFYLFTCEYCFSHYVAALFLLLTRFTLLLPGWRGYVIAWFSLVWIANAYMSLFGRLRLDIKHERVEIEEEERTLGRMEEKAKPRSILPARRESR